MRLLRALLRQSPARVGLPFARCDPEGIEGLVVAIFCPPCAAAELGHRPDIAAEHVCIWKPVASDTHGPSAEDN